MRAICLLFGDLVLFLFIGPCLLCSLVHSQWCRSTWPGLTRVLVIQRAAGLQGVVSRAIRKAVVGYFLLCSWGHKDVPSLWEGLAWRRERQRVLAEDSVLTIHLPKTPVIAVTLRQGIHSMICWWAASLLVPDMFAEGNLVKRSTARNLEHPKRELGRGSHAEGVEEIRSQQVRALSGSQILVALSLFWWSHRVVLWDFYFCVCWDGFKGAYCSSVSWGRNIVLYLRLFL